MREGQQANGAGGLGPPKGWRQRDEEEDRPRKVEEEEDGGERGNYAVGFRSNSCRHL